MSPEERGEVRILLSNWGRWAGGALDDPALVHYYTVSPMFRDAPFIRKGLKSVPPTDDQLAEMAEQAMLRLWKRWPKQFRLLRAKYAYNTHHTALSERWGVSTSTLYERLRDAEELFLDAFRTIHLSE